MTNPLFSIVIPTYNRATLLQRCLQSVVTQTYNYWEAIVVDNFSDDNTEEVVKSFHDDRIVYVKNHNHGVIAVSRNKALDMAKGDWICFLDSDDCWLSNKLEFLLPYLDNYDLIYHGYRQNIPKTRPFQKRDRFFYEIKEPSIDYVLMRGDPINPSCSCVRKSSIGTIRFDESKELIAVEDYDFFLLLIEKNIRIKYLKVVLTLYDVGGCSHSFLGNDNELKLYQKWSEKLTKKQQEEVHRQYLLRRAIVHLSNKSYKEADNCYKEVVKSKILRKKIEGVKGRIKCFLKINKLF